jgi:hypothetical protein
VASGLHRNAFHLDNMHAVGSGLESRRVYARQLLPWRRNAGIATRFPAEYYSSIDVYYNISTSGRNGRYFKWIQRAEIEQASCWHNPNEICMRVESDEYALDPRIVCNGEYLGKGLTLQVIT